MDTMKMVAELKTACSALENEKSKLVARVKQIDDDLTAYHMAMDSLELTIRNSNKLPVLNTIKTKPVVEKQKRRSRKDAAVLDYNGSRKTIAEWSEETGISTYTIRYRLQHGWSTFEALSKPVDPVRSEAGKRNQYAKPQKVFAYDQHDNVIRQYVGVGEASRDLNLPVTTVEKLIEHVPKEDQIRCRNYYLAYHS